VDRLIAQIPEIEGTITTVDCFNVSVKKSIIKIADTVNQAKGRGGWHLLLSKPTPILFKTITIAKA
jgi:hypothetical protein